MDQLNRLPQMTVVIGLGMLLAELFLGIEAGFDLVMIGSILIFSGLLGTFTGSYPIMVVVAILLSIMYLLVGRSYVKQKISSVHIKTNLDKLVGHTGIVTKAIEPDEAGQVKVDDETWRAKSDEMLTPNTKVKITAIHGVTLTVSKS